MSSKTAEKYSKQLARINRELKYVKLGLMKVSPVAQREFMQAWADHLFSVWDLDKFETPEVSYRDGYYYIVNGQHSIDALKRYLGPGWQDQYIECWVATGLTEAQEAERFLGLSDVKPINCMNKFKISICAGREMEVEINKIVTNEKLFVSSSKQDGAIGSVATLKRVFKRDGPDSLRKALAIARDAYGTMALKAAVIDGLGLFCHRYNGMVDEKTAIASLANIHGGINGLLNMAEALRSKLGGSKAGCVAAAAVDIINRGRKGKNRLASWWKE